MNNKFFGFFLAAVCIVSTNAFSMTTLHQAVSAYNREEVGKLLGEKTDINAKDLSSMTPLHYATMLSNEQDPNAYFIETLLAAGAHCNVMDNDGWTPLHWACLKGNLNATKKLIARYRDHNQLDGINAQSISHKLTPLHVAIREGNSACARELILNGEADITIVIAGATLKEWATDLCPDLVPLLEEIEHNDLENDAATESAQWYDSLLPIKCCNLV